MSGTVNAMSGTQSVQGLANVWRLTAQPPAAKTQPEHSSCGHFCAQLCLSSNWLPAPKPNVATGTAVTVKRITEPGYSSQLLQLALDRNEVVSSCHGSCSSAFLTQRTTGTDHLPK